MQQNYLKVRPSSIEGYGAFALKYIPHGTRIIEYMGEHITPAVAQGRYCSPIRYQIDADDEMHIYLFTVDSNTLIDGAVGGSDARFINHSCAPNCEAVVEDGHVYIQAIKGIEPGEELTFDYQLSAGSALSDKEQEHFACHCGAVACRGTMLAPEKGKHAAPLAATYADPVTKESTAMID